MVVKPRIVGKLCEIQFESSVISYGSKAFNITENGFSRFESSVISYGSKAKMEQFASTSIV